MLKRLFLATMLSFSVSVKALDMSNPSSPTLPKEGLFIPADFFMGVRLEYQAERVFDKSLSVTTSSVKKVEDFEQDIQKALLSFTFADQFEVYAGLGASRLQMATAITSAILQEYTTGNRLTWEVGAKGQIFNYDKGALALDLKYAYTHPSVDTLTINGVLTPQHLKIKYEEWQLGLGGSYEFDFFTPYLGVVYSHPSVKVRRFASGILPNSKKSYKVQGQKKFGISVGVSMAAIKGFVLNLEMRAIDESALTLTAVLAF